ncbi:MAG: cyclic nucleotide-binding domain-containing protein [Anaerolineales bacterium]|nr:cyclic nucleotide-binding domain-containing protein [Anaerolineales bacterium]
MDHTDFIPQLPLFANLTAQAAQALSAIMEEKKLPSGAVLFRQGDPGNGFYIVISGKLSASQHMPDGTDALLSPLGSGECAGELSLLTGQPYHLTLVASEDTRLLFLPKSTIDRLAEEQPAMFIELTDALLPRFQEAQVNQALTRLFGQLDESVMRDLQSRLEWRHLDCGEILCRQGEPGNEMYIVIQGRLRFEVEINGITRDLGEVGAGESIGEFSLLTESGSPESIRSATVYATRLTDVVVISRSIFENMLCQSPQALLKLTRQIIRRELRISRSAPISISAQVIAVVPLQPGPLNEEFTRQLADSFGILGSTLLLDPHRFEQLYGKPNIAQTPLDHPASLLISTWLDERERQHHFAVYDTQPVLDEMGSFSPWAQRCIEDADIILLVGEASVDPALTAVESALASAQTRARLELVLLHPTGCPAPSGTAAWLAPRRSAYYPLHTHHHVRLGNLADYRRLSRRLSGRPVGLALSGGGARGWAHIGVMKAMEEANLEVDWVGGASMGAIIAAGIALDWPVERLRELAASFSDPKKLLDYTLPYSSITATRRITSLLQELCGNTQIEDTWRPYFCISANLTRGEEQLHDSGTLWKAMRASMAFPAVFAPILDQGCVLIDGGAANNLPIDRLRELCPTGTVVGVDLITSSPTVGPYSFGPSLSGWQALWARLSPFSRRVRAPNLLDIVAGIVYSNNRYRLNEVLHCADLLIRVPVEAYGLLEFDKYSQIIELGYQSAKEQLQGFKR